MGPLLFATQPPRGELRRNVRFEPLWQRTAAASRVQRFVMGASAPTVVSRHVIHGCGCSALPVLMLMLLNGPCCSLAWALVAIVTTKSLTAMQLNYAIVL